MNFSSSPLHYPQTSSPRIESPNKRRKVYHDANPVRPALKNVTNTVAGFLVDDDSEEESDVHSKPRHLSSYQDEDENQDSIDLAASPLQASKSLQTPPDSESDVLPTFKPGSHRLQPANSVVIETCSGKKLYARQKKSSSPVHYERMVAARSKVEDGRAQKNFYGIDIHELVKSAELEVQSRAQSALDVEQTTTQTEPRSKDKQARVRVKPTLLWTEKYRARKFTDLVGDERTHRAVLHWFKAWDDIVFPGQQKLKVKSKALQDRKENERQHRKILLLTGPPGLGKTTLAHVCAKQAGYEVQEINASDERSRDVVRGRIRDMVGTENVKSVSAGDGSGAARAAKPVCVVVDEVDGVVGGNSSAGGEGGFVKALLELLVLDQRNSARLLTKPNSLDVRKKAKGDNFRMMRPIVLICNDLYHPSLRLLRQGSVAEIVYVRKPTLNTIVPRMQMIFEKEGVPCDSDGVRHLCEAAWGVSTRKEDRTASGGTLEGDIRGILVLGEWVGRKLRNMPPDDSEQPGRLTKRWIEKNLLADLAHGGSGSKNLGRGGSKEVVDRIFLNNAGFPVSSRPTGKASVRGDHVAEAGKQLSLSRLQEMIASSGEDDKIMTDIFATYPTMPFQDDTLLTKPGQAYEWLNFHSRSLHQVQTQQEWELAAYLSYPVLAFHLLFAGNLRSRSSVMDHTEQEDANSSQPMPYSGLRAAYTASEATKANVATLAQFQNGLSVPLQRSFRSHGDLATELVPYVLRILNPDVKPVVVGGGSSSIASVRKGSERALVNRSANAMIAAGIKFERSKVEFGLANDETSGGHSAAGNSSAGWVMRMEPPLDELGSYSTTDAGKVKGEKVRYAVRAVLEQEWKKESSRVEGEARTRRTKGEVVATPAAEAKTLDTVRTAGVTGPAIQRDFFGRPMQHKVNTGDAEGADGNEESGRQRALKKAKQEDRSQRIWVTFHEGFSNAVRKPITLKELLDGL